MLALPGMLFLLPMFLPETLPWMPATKLHSMFYLMPGYELSWFWEQLQEGKMDMVGIICWIELVSVRIS